MAGPSPSQRRMRWLQHGPSIQRQGIDNLIDGHTDLSKFLSSPSFHAVESARERRFR